jgi:hypothetical protein
MARGQWSLGLGPARAAAAVGLTCLGLLASSAPALAGFGVSKWEAGTCTSSECTKGTPEDFYTKAAGHPPYGITDFALNTSAATGAPEGKIKKVRVDIPSGLSVDPLATSQCKLTALGLVGCPGSAQVGEVRLKIHLLSLIPAEITVPVYNMEPSEGVPLEADFEPAPGEIVHIVGGIDWSGDYHEFFTIKVPNGLAELVESRLIFFGTAISGGTLPFITMPSPCSGPQTTYLKVTSYEETEGAKSFTTGPPDLAEPIGITGCEQVPFEPAIAARPATTQSDRPDGATVEVKVPQDPGPKELDSSTLKDAHVTLPDGMTLNPAAASGLESCNDEQFHKGSEHAIECPPGSVIGTDTIETPDLPPSALTGDVYVGRPLSNSPESGQEYRIFIAAQSTRYGVGVRLIGNVSANAANGRLTTAVIENPQVPFSDFIIHFDSPRNPLANPLACGPATTNSTFVPYSGNAPAFPSEAFTVDFDGKGGACPSPLPFGVTQSTALVPTTAGASSRFSYGLVRPEGQQYLSKLTTTLPAGLVADIAAIKPLCGEPQAGSGECSAASEIGSASVTVGSGAHPYPLSGRVYLTGSYGGAPYGLSVVVPAEKVGPYDYGKIVTRASIDVDPYTANVLISTQLPTVVGGAPVRLRALSVNVNRPGFMLNPTGCEPLTVQTALISTFGTAGSTSSSVQATGCSALGFAPKFTASTKAKTSRAIGAALKTRLVFGRGPQANVKSVFVQLPKQFPARTSTLNLACREAVFAANPFSCPPGAYVGTVTVSTPVLPDKLTGSAILVSHGGAAFPDLDLLLTGDGINMILVGHTNIVKNIISSNFASLPDVPVSSVEVKLPQGRKSALGAVGNLCTKPLLMPTTITGQNGKTVKQKTRIAVAGCPRKHRRGHKRHHHSRRSRHRHATHGGH